MTFSPYTLSGHQFTGGGLELSPKGGFKFSAMSGRLLKATPAATDPRTQIAFERMGYGAKIAYDKKKYKIGLIGFYAKDKAGSIPFVPDEQEIFPKENLVISLEGAYQFSPNFKVSAEYATTTITQDTRAEDNASSQGLAGLFFKGKSSTEYYKAIKAGFDYTFGKSTLGLAYERIDPGYQTLGAYYFNNDFENITLNSKTTLFKNKLGLTFNIGYQRDNLNKQKKSASNRAVASVNATFAASKRLNLTGSYTILSIKQV